MKFTVQATQLKDALESLMVKGKHLTTNGFGNTNLGTDVYACLEGNTLSLFNGSVIFLVKVNLSVTGEENGEVSFDSSSMIPYLKSFKDEVAIEVGDFVSIVCGSKKASIPKLVQHQENDVIIRLKNMTSHIRYEPNPETLWNFSKFTYEGAFTLNIGSFKDCIKNCELVKEGIYKLDYNNNQPTFSTTMNAQNNYTETIDPVFSLGEPATLEFSGAMYSFFENDQLLNFYVKDECPLLIVAEDRLLLKTPHIGGN